jgi:hypothetical protein
MKPISKNGEQGTAENGGDFRRFSAAIPAVRGEVNWYTFESLAGEIRTVRRIHYYYY